MFCNFASSNVLPSSCWSHLEVVGFYCSAHFVLLRVDGSFDWFLICREFLRCLVVLECSSDVVPVRDVCSALMAVSKHGHATDPIQMSLIRQ